MDDDVQTGPHRLPDESQWMRLLQRHRSDHPALLRIVSLFDRLQDRPHRTHCLLYGEPGTGKEGLARALHALMHLGSGPFVEAQLAHRDVGVAAAELCGEPGAPGLIEKAEGGTLYIDEVSLLPREIQQRILSAMRGKHRREGETEERPTHVTIIASTDVDLRAEVSARRFRHDLFWRLARIELLLPPLRERRADIARLALWIGTRILSRAELPGRLQMEDEDVTEGSVILTDEAVEALTAHDWPGNLRELDAVLERAMMLYADRERVGAKAIHAALAGLLDAPIVE